MEPGASKFTSEQIANFLASSEEGRAVADSYAAVMMERNSLLVEAMVASSALKALTAVSGMLDVKGSDTFMGFVVQYVLGLLEQLPAAWLASPDEIAALFARVNNDISDYMAALLAAPPLSEDEQTRLN